MVAPQSRPQVWVGVAGERAPEEIGEHGGVLAQPGLPRLQGVEVLVRRRGRAGRAGSRWGGLAGSRGGGLAGTLLGRREFLVEGLHILEPARDRAELRDDRGRLLKAAEVLHLITRGVSQPFPREDEGHDAAPPPVGLNLRRGERFGLEAAFYQRAPGRRVEERHRLRRWDPQVGRGLLGVVADARQLGIGRGEEVPPEPRVDVGDCVQRILAESAHRLDCGHHAIAQGRAVVAQPERFQLGKMGPVDGHPRVSDLQRESGESGCQVLRRGPGSFARCRGCRHELGHAPDEADHPSRGKAALPQRVHARRFAVERGLPDRKPPCPEEALAR